MKSGKFWLAVLVGGVVANIMDYLVFGMWLGQEFFMKNPALFRQDTNVAWYVVGDFISVFVFAWVLNKVSSLFGSTMQAGATAGLYLGILVNFPTWIFANLMFNGYPYSLSWINTIYGIIWYVIIGAVLTMVMKKSTTTAAA